MLRWWKHGLCIDRWPARSLPPALCHRLRMTWCLASRVETRPAMTRMKTTWSSILGQWGESRECWTFCLVVEGIWLSSLIGDCTKRVREWVYIRHLIIVYAESHKEALVERTWRSCEGFEGLLRENCCLLSSCIFLYSFSLLIVLNYCQDVTTPLHTNTRNDNCGSLV